MWESPIRSWILDRSSEADGKCRAPRRPYRRGHRIALSEAPSGSARAGRDLARVSLAPGGLLVRVAGSHGGRGWATQSDRPERTGGDGG